MSPPLSELPEERFLLSLTQSTEETDIVQIPGSAVVGMVLKGLEKWRIEVCFYRVGEAEGFLKKSPRTGYCSTLQKALIPQLFLGSEATMAGMTL
jgi:hypothetical protein